jgi:hypothetical protein
MIKVKDITAILNKMDQESSVKFIVKDDDHYDYYEVKIRSHLYMGVVFNLRGHWSEDKNLKDILDSNENEQEKEDDR